MSDLVAQCKEILEEKPFEERRDGEITELVLQLPLDTNASRKLIIDVKRHLVLIYSTLKQGGLTEEGIRKALRFVTKANELLDFGNIEINVDAAEFRFKTSHSFPGINNARAVLRFMLERQEFVFPKLENAVKDLGSPEKSAVDIACQHFRGP